MGKMRLGSLLFLTFLLAGSAAAANVGSFQRSAPEQRGDGWEQRLEFEAPARDGARLILRAASGAVDIRPGGTGKFKCVVVMRTRASDEAAARRAFDRVQPSIRPLEGGGFHITSEMEGRGGHRGHGGGLGLQFRVTVPERFSVDVETQGGDVTVGALLVGEARLTTAGGDVRVASIAGPLRVETAGGNISLGKTEGRVDARTAGGAIRVTDITGDASLETSGGEISTGRVTGALQAETAGGDVVIGGASGQVVAQTAGGQILIGPTGSSVRAETAGGSIRLQGARGRVVADTAGGSIDLLQIESAVKASTSAGRILAQFNGAKQFGSSELETSMGDVYVYLPINVALTIDAAIDAAAGHHILSDFPLTIQGQQEDVVASTVRGRGALNGGGEILRIRTVAGNIEIKKIDAQSLRDLEQREANTWRAWDERRAEKQRRFQAREAERQKDKDRDDDD